MLVHANNLDISDVHLRVWSCSAPFVTWPALLGLGALCLVMCFFLRRTAARPMASAPASRLLQQIDLQPPQKPAHDAVRAPEVAAAPPRPKAPLRKPSSCVVNALRDVLMHGLAVPTEYDTTRRKRG